MTTPLGVSEKVYYAQIIIDAYAKSLDADNCMTKVPQAIYSQAEIYEQTLVDALDALGQDKEHESEFSYTYTKPEDLPVSEVITTQQNSGRNQELVNSIKQRLNQECIPCGIPKLNVNLKDIFGNLLVNIKAFIDLINGILSRLTPSFCHFAYLLSFLCIPDLVKILALILARILQLITALSIGIFSIGAFIFAIIGAILRALVQFVMGILNIALSPLTCLLQSIEDALQKIPTEEVLRRQLSNEEYKLLYGKEKPTEPSETPVDGYQDKLSGKFADIVGSVREEFQKVSQTLQNAGAGIDEAIQELFGLKNFMECEPQRNTNVFQKIEALVDLIQIANLIRTLIAAKVKRSVIDELCRYQDPMSSTQPLTPMQLAVVIEDATGKVVEIIESDGNPVGLIVKPETEENPDNLSIWSCNMAEFMRGSDLNNLIQEAVDIVTAELKGPEFAQDPQKYVEFSYTNLSRYTPRINQGSKKNRTRTTVKYGDVFLPNRLSDFVRPKPLSAQDRTVDGTNSDPLNNRDYEIVLFDTPEGLPQPIEVINEIFSYIPLQNKSMLNFFTVEEENREKLVQAKNDSIKNRASGNLTYNSYIINNSILQSVQSTTNVEIPVLGDNTSKAAQIKCGTIENIRSNFDLLK